MWARSVLSDTVGFIRHLPHGLVAAFRSTLEETAQADLLLHVVDANSPERDRPDGRGEQGVAGDRCAAYPADSGVQQDRPAGLPAGVERDEYGRIARIHLSARTGAGWMDCARHWPKCARRGRRNAQSAASDQEWHPLEITEL